MSEPFEKDRDKNQQEAEMYSFERFFDTCDYCGVKRMENEKFCHNCGHAVEEKTLSQPLETNIAKEKVRKKQTGNKSFVLNLMKNSLVLAMAIFMLIAAFLPIIKWEVDLSDVINDGKDNETLLVRFSAIDGISLLVNSFFSWDEEDISDESNALWEDAEEYAEEWEDGEELDELARLLKKELSLALRSETQKPTVGMVTVAVLSLLQILFALLLFGFAAFSFASSFTNAVQGVPKLSFVWMGLTAVIMFTNAFAFQNEFGLNQVITKFTAMQICIPIFTVFVMAVFVVFRFALEKGKIGIGTIIKHALSLLFAVILLFSAFAPIISTEVKTIFKNSDSSKRATSTLDRALFYNFSLSEEEKEDMDDMDDSSKEPVANLFLAFFEDYTKREFTNGEADTINQSLYSWLLLARGAYEYSGVFAFGVIALIAIVFCALLLIWQNLYELAIGRRIHLSISIAIKIVAILMAIMILALVIIMSVIVNVNADTYYSIIYKSKIAYGPILMLICAVAAICVPPAISKNSCQYSSDLCLEKDETEAWENSTVTN